MTQLMCDLCGKPIYYHPKSVLFDRPCIRYKVKRYRTCFDYQWVTLDCHPSCAEKLFDAKQYPTAPSNGSNIVR